MKTKTCLLAVCSVALTGLIVIFAASAAEDRSSGSMKMDEPMAGEMKKKGMKQGDVRKHGETWDRKMKEMIGKEEKTVSQETAKK